jgi:hypothetical protein
MWAAMLTYESGAALAAARKEIAERLRPFCEYCSTAEFEELVDRVARIDVKYRTRDVLDLLMPPPIPRQLWADLHMMSQPSPQSTKGMNSAA